VNGWPIQRFLFLAVALAYLALALPLPAVLLDHELGLLTGSSAHTSLDDHAWLDHAAGSGMASGDVEIAVVDRVVPLILPVDSYYKSYRAQVPSVRGPPVR
jgi:hypothetical protein